MIRILRIIKFSAVLKNRLIQLNNNINSMKQDNKIVFFQDKSVRCILKNEECYFSVIDFISILTESPQSEKYWWMLKKYIETSKLNDEPLYQWIELDLLTIKGKDYTNKKGLYLFLENTPSNNKEIIKQWLE